MGNRKKRLKKGFDRSFKLLVVRIITEIQSNKQQQKMQHLLILVLHNETHKGNVYRSTNFSEKNACMIF